MVLAAMLPIVHLLSLAALDALSRLPLLKVRMLSAAVFFCSFHCTYVRVGQGRSRVVDKFCAG